MQQSSAFVAAPTRVLLCARARGRTQRSPTRQSCSNIGSAERCSAGQIRFVLLVARIRLFTLALLGCVSLRATGANECSTAAGAPIFRHLAIVGDVVARLLHGKDDSYVLMLVRQSGGVQIPIALPIVLSDGVRPAKPIPPAESPTPATVISVHSGLLHATTDNMKRVTTEAPTAALLMDASATVLLAAARLWVSYRQGREAAEELPFDEARFAQLAREAFGDAVALHRTTEN